MERFQAKGYEEQGDKRPSKVSLKFSEPVDAVDWAEEFLEVNPRGFVTVHFNGDNEPHYALRKVDDGRYGIHNSGKSLWPISYAPPEGVDLPTFGIPLPEAETEESDPVGDHADDDYNPFDEGEEDEFEDEGEEEDEDVSDDDSEGSSESDDGDGDSESEAEEPRVKLFARIFHGARRRKRMETEEDRSRNTFDFQVGVLDETEGLKLRQQERDQRIRITVTEKKLEGQPQNLSMRIRIPNNCMLEDVSEEWQDFQTFQVKDIPIKDEEDFNL